MIVGLRVDVDTLRGTRSGVPKLCNLFKQSGVAATFFFSVGPDNMGRHLWRLLRPAFLRKMLRSGAPRLYGWDILLRGVFWPGPLIGKRCADIIRRTAAEGHEVGLHAWDHHHWQMHIDQMSKEDMVRAIRLGYSELTSILGKPPTCSAVPGWKCNEATLLAKSNFSFRYNSDCRGHSIFIPALPPLPAEARRVRPSMTDGLGPAQPQIPVTLPTYDEVIGRNGITDQNYNDYLLGLMQDDRLHVLTIHAEVEGLACADMFAEFLQKANAKGIKFVPLSALLPGSLPPSGKIVAREFPGREGWVCCQA